MPSLHEVSIALRGTRGKLLHASVRALQYVSSASATFLDVHQRVPGQLNKRVGKR